MPSPIRTSFLLLLTFLIAACGSEPDDRDDTRSIEQRREAALAQAAKRQSDAAQEMFDSYFHDSLELDPRRASQLGEHQHNDRLANVYSSEWRQEKLALEQRYLNRALAINANQLPDADVLSHLLFVRERHLAIDSLEQPDHLLPIDHVRNPVNEFVELAAPQGAHRFDNEADYRAFLSRMDDFVNLIQQLQSNLAEGLEQRIVLPEVLVGRVVEQLDTHLRLGPEASALSAPLQTIPESVDAESASEIREQWQQRLTESVFPAIEGLRDYLQHDYRPLARATFGLSQLPAGESWYSFLVRRHTTTELSPTEIHQLGLNEVERQRDAIQAVMDEMDFDGDLSDFFQHLLTDDAFAYASADNLLADYRTFADRLEQAVGPAFSALPEAAFEIHPVEPYQAASAPAVSYRAPAPDGSRPGVVTINSHNLDLHRSWARSAMLLQHSLPGRHLQLALQQQLTDLPAFRRHANQPAFVKGWGLYAQHLGFELGLLDDPWQRTGALISQLDAAVKLVVDTGIHSRGWTREQSIDYLMTNLPIERNEAELAIDRHMATPARALAYKIGQMRILEQRETAERRLGQRFDLAEFHHQVLKDGALPLDVLQNRIQRWLDEKYRANGYRTNVNNDQRG